MKGAIYIGLHAVSTCIFHALMFWMHLVAPITLINTTAEVQLGNYSWWILEAVTLTSCIRHVLVTDCKKLKEVRLGLHHIIFHQDLSSAACCNQVESTLLHSLEVPTLHPSPKTSHHGIDLLQFCSTHSDKCWDSNVSSYHFHFTVH